jgi:hypothetical protein
VVKDFSTFFLLEQKETKTQDTAIAYALLIFAGKTSNVSKLHCSFSRQKSIHRLSRIAPCQGQRTSQDLDWY